MRLRISPAALLVNVTARMLLGEAPSTWISQATRCTSTRVLPLPAPGEHQRGAERRSDGLALRVIETIEQMRYVHQGADCTAAGAATA